MWPKYTNVLFILSLLSKVKEFFMYVYVHLHEQTRGDHFVSLFACFIVFSSVRFKKAYFAPIQLDLSCMQMQLSNYICMA